MFHSTDPRGIILIKPVIYVCRSETSFHHEVQCSSAALPVTKWLESHSRHHSVTSSRIPPHAPFLRVFVPLYNISLSSPLPSQHNRFKCYSGEAKKIWTRKHQEGRGSRTYILWLKPTELKQATITRNNSTLDNRTIYLNRTCDFPRSLGERRMGAWRERKLFLVVVGGRLLMS